MKAANYAKPGILVIAVTVITCVVLAVCFLTNPISKDKNLPQLSDEKKTEIEISFYDNQRSGC